MPFEGSRMVRLNPSPKRKFSYARRIMDLAEHPSIVNGQTRRLEVMASFNTPGTERCIALPNPAGCVQRKAGEPACDLER